MKILVLQHERVEHPGAFRAFLDEDGHSWDPVHLNEGEAIPPLDGYDALWVMGGPMDVWDDLPWLAPEKTLIREAVAERGMPFLGLCLGHQLLAEALGGEVGKGTPEIGVMEVRLTEEGASGVFLDGLPERFEVLQWHGAEIERLPEGASVLATSPDCAVQAMRWGTRALSLQFHLEVEAGTVPEWNAIPAYAEALRDAMGDDGPARLEADVAERLPRMNDMAERIYINWLQAAART